LQRVWAKRGEVFKVKPHHSFQKMGKLSMRGGKKEREEEFCLYERKEVNDGYGNEELVKKSV